MEKLNICGVVGVCVVVGWFMQPHLAPVRLNRLWSWVRLHVCGALADQAIQVQPDTTTHTHSSGSADTSHITLPSALAV